MNKRGKGDSFQFKSLITDVIKPASPRGTCMACGTILIPTSFALMSGTKGGIAFRVECSCCIRTMTVSVELKRSHRKMFKKRRGRFVPIRWN